VSDAYVTSLALMGTVVSIQVVGHGTSARARRERTRAVDCAIEWFRHVETVCTRFDTGSELRRLSAVVGTPVPVSDTLFEALGFALAVAEESNGAFDPTVGRRMEARGFDREYRTDHVIRSGLEASEQVSYRDVEVDAVARTVTLHRPLVLDLGAVAKGLAVDMAARELAPFENFAIDAGGDLFLAGHNADGGLWRVGIRHPRNPGELLETVQVSGSAVCTSGDYERKVAHDSHHILDPSTGLSSLDAASVTVIAGSAMVADAFATAAFVLGRVGGIGFLERQGAEGLVVTGSMDRYCTRAWPDA